MKIRVGMEGNRKLLLDVARAKNIPILVSANSLWNNARRQFHGFRCYAGFDIALDSGGFVAMAKYGGYRWTVPDYVGLANKMQPAWWAQMDFCCEPQIATDKRAVHQRITLTAEHLHACNSVAIETGTAKPMPVLQGWEPADYCVGPIYHPDFQWPELVGIGSVCRREVNGPNGIMAVVAALDQVVPGHVQFHLFGVKSTAIERLAADFPHRCASMDSMAWSLAARKEAFANGTGCDNRARCRAMEKWYDRQQARLQRPLQMTLL